MGFSPPDIVTAAASTAIKVEAYDLKCPDIPTDLPKEHFEQYFRDTYCLMRNNLHMPGWAAYFASIVTVAPAGAVLLLSHYLLLLLEPFLPALGGAVFHVIDDVRKTIDPEVAGFAVAVLNELLGTEFTPDHLAQGKDVASHIQRAQEVGLLFHKQLMSEFLASTGITLNAGTGQFGEPTGPTGAREKITPIQGVRAAARFSGFAINFGTATGILATLGGLVPFIHLDEIREIGEEVARNLGIGRLQRMALKPLIQILLAEPYKWFLNELARPTQFKLNDVINQFTGSIMPAEILWTSLAREGYSDDKVTALLEVHRKKLSESDVLNLFRAGHFDEPQVVEYYRRLGYTEEDSTRKKEADVIKANEPYVQELRSALVAAYAEGHIDQHEFDGLIDGLPLRAEEKAWIKLAAGYKLRVPHAHLTIAELQSAYEQGIIDLKEFSDHLAVRGFSDDDTQILELLTLLKLKKLKETAAAKQARATAKARGKPPAPAPPETPPAG